MKDKRRLMIDYNVLIELPKATFPGHFAGDEVEIAGKYSVIQSVKNDIMKVLITFDTKQEADKFMAIINRAQSNEQS